jgi:hypothetical protein
LAEEGDPQIAQMGADFEGALRPRKSAQSADIFAVF